MVFRPFEPNRGKKEPTTGRNGSFLLDLETERKGVRERLKRSVVSTAPSALRHGVTSETEDWITQ